MAEAAEKEPHKGDEMEWRPIETAPKDGSLILLHCQFGHVGRGSWRAVSEWMPDASGDRVKAFGEAKWHGPGIYQPTHWMPLPASPSSPDPHKGRG